MISIITHRGLEPSRSVQLNESSYEAFHDHLDRGYGIEFDPYFLPDITVVSHHKTERGDTAPLLSSILELISRNKNATSALHLKGKFQEKKFVDRLIKDLQVFPNILNRLLIFDIKESAAKYLKKQIPEVVLAPSVAHQHDIVRFNSVVLGTLMSIEDAILNKHLFDWVWLDEWDRLDQNGYDKTFYNNETFQRLRYSGFKIGLVSPELHRTSPGLLGGEAHPDALNRDVLFKRITEILDLHPDAICTDFPEEVKSILQV